MMVIEVNRLSSTSSIPDGHRQERQDARVQVRRLAGGFDAGAVAYGLALYPVQQVGADVLPVDQVIPDGLMWCFCN